MSAGAGAVVTFSCGCGQELTVPLGTPWVLCQACNMRATVPGLPPPPSAGQTPQTYLPPPPPSGMGPQTYLPPPPAPAKLPRRTATIIMRLISGPVLIGLALSINQSDFRANDDTLYLLVLLCFPLGAAFILGGLYELVSGNRIGLLGKE